MLKIRRILFPTDFSECSERAYATAAGFARRFGAELHVVHVVTTRWHPAVESSFVPRFEDEAAELQFEPPGIAGMERTKHPFPVIINEAYADSAARAILDYEREYDIDLTVMGTHGRRGVDRRLLGSVAETVASRSFCPVVTVHAGLQGRFEIRFEKLLVLIDFSDAASLALTYARALAMVFGSRLDVVTVVEDQLQPLVYGIEPVTVALPEIEVRTRIARDELERLVRETGCLDVPVAVHAVPGHFPADVARLAESFESDLIVLATRGRTGLGRLLAGSAVGAVVRTAPCPVFSVRSFGKSILSAPSARSRTVTA